MPDLACFRQIHDIAFIIFLWYDIGALKKHEKENGREPQMKGLRTMKKVICKVEYDTESSELIQKKVFGAFGDADGYEEDLYKTQDGKLFLYGVGGPESPYAEETIKRMSAAKAAEWQKA